MLKQIKCIFFDVGSTLVDESVAYNNRIKRAIKNTAVNYDEFYDKMIEFYRQNKRGDKEAAKFFGLALPEWDSNDEFAYPQAKKCLKNLSKDYNIGIIANQNFGTEQRLQNWGLQKYISLVITSAEFGTAKPDLTIFKIALLKANCNPENAVMVGDRLDNDIAPAKKLGMKTIWIKQGFGGLSTVITKHETPDYTINNLDELYDLFLD